MEPSAPGLVRDAYLGAEADQLVDRALLGGTHVGRGQDAHGDASCDGRTKGFTNQHDAGPLEEGAEEIDGSGRVDLRFELSPELGLPAGINEQVGPPERELRPK